ncbi:Na+/H+ antiporter NhaC [Jonesiaceae bacterium BS-20]|uniref:Na+/H+ antiporter NhaC n=1 Tax=Jonesiaceae bacterium BS-20 TaxID=3120821 RepID=A0AAU7DV16_9MICO
MREKGLPSLTLALTPIIAMFVFMGVGAIWIGLPAEPMLILSAIIAGVIAKFLGYNYTQMITMISEKIAKVMPALLILVTVGFLIGAWMVGGTIPMLIYYGLEIVSPAYIYITALVVTSIVAVCTGTSWGSAGTIGVAFMGVALGMEGVNLAIVAGAILCGAYFGDKFSPLSDSTNLAAAVTRVDLFVHIRHLLYTTVPSWIVAAIVMIIAGFTVDTAGGSGSEKVAAINGTLESAFSWNLFLLLPVVIILYGSMRKLPTIPVMLVSSAIAMINALVFQGFSLIDTFNSIVSGFSTDMFGEGFDLGAAGDDIMKLLNRGGMSSMMNTLLIAFCALAFAGILSVTRSLDKIVDSLLNVVNSTGSLILATIATAMLTIATTCNGQVSVLMPGELLRPAYIRRGLHPKNLGRTVEDAGTMIEPLLPWTAAGAYMAGTLGVATIEYVPWATFLWTGIIFAAIWGYTGFGIAKLTPQEQEQMIKELDEEAAAAANV